jgi:hypothetical protein
MAKYLIVTSTILLTAWSAAAEPSLLQRQQDWGVYAHQMNGSKYCYVLSAPSKAEPPTVDHGRNFFIASLSRDGRWEPQIQFGYDLSEATSVSVTIGPSSFSLAPHGRTAWVVDRGEEAAFVSRMKSGADLSVTAVSKRGTATSYSYSLRGLSAAMTSASTCRQ